MDETLLDQAVMRTARKDHKCHGAYDHEQQRHVRCLSGGTIAKGSRYIEYFGESPAYQSGDRYHVECARTEGLIS